VIGQRLDRYRFCRCSPVGIGMRRRCFFPEVWRKRARSHGRLRPEGGGL